MPWLRRRPTGDFADEVRSHLELEAERLVAEGMTPDAARLEARRRFGNITASVERYHEAGRWRWADRLAQDVRGALRALRRYPIASGIAILSFAGGTGSTATMLAFKRAIFDAPPPLYAEPAQLSRVRLSAPEQPLRLVPGPLLDAWMRDEGTAWSIAAATQGRRLEIATADRTEIAQVRSVTPQLFATLGVAPSLGRAPVPDGRAGAVPVVISDGIWERVFERRPDVLGRVVHVQRTPHVVVGVLPPRFWFGSYEPAVWRPVSPSELAAADTSFDVVVRRGPGVSADRVATELQRGVAAYGRERPAERALRPYVRSIAGTPIGEQIAPYVVWLLQGAVYLTFLIACTNIAVLMIAQWTAREHELAIRTSLGASRARLVRALATESVCVAAAGGGLGLAGAFALRGALERGGAGSLIDLRIDAVVLAITTLAVFGAGLVTGLVPAVHETGRLQGNPLQRLAVPERVRQRWRHALVLFEIAATVALLVVSAAMLSAYHRMVSADLAFDPRPLLAARIEIAPEADVQARADVLRTLPGVTHVAVASDVPLVSSGPMVAVARGSAETPALRVERVEAGPGFFATLGVALRAGRDFEAGDARTRVAIVNEPLARSLWRGRSPVGTTLHIEGLPYEVIGVAAGFATHSLRPRQGAVVVPWSPAAHRRHVHVVVRASGPLEETIRAMQRALTPADPSGEVPFVFALGRIVRVGAAEVLATVAPLAPLVAIGLFLSATGIYGVLAFALVRRSRELAVRVAIGAGRRHLAGLVFGQTARLAGAGAGLGLLATYILTRIAQGRGGIFDSPGWEAFLGPALVIGIVAVAATLMPLRRALRLDPARLLR